MNSKLVILGSLLLASAGPVRAHAVHHAVDRAEAVVVTLSHADGSPFADAPFQLLAPGGASPWQSGRTDAAGRVAFLPDRPGEWRLKAATPDGHGADVAIRVDPPGAAAPAAGDSRAEAGVALDAPPVATAPSAGERASRLVTGVALLFGIFGVLALALRRRG